MHHKVALVVSFKPLDCHPAQPRRWRALEPGLGLVSTSLKFLHVEVSTKQVSEVTVSDRISKLTMTRT